MGVWRRWEEREDEILKGLLAERKWTDRDIAYIMGRCARVVAKYRRRHGVAPVRRGGMHGLKHSEETKARISASVKSRLQEPEMRARVLSNAALARQASPVLIKVLPPEGTPAFRRYRKLQRNLGTEAARREMGL